jgi:hypothetical protein
MYTVTLFGAVQTRFSTKKKSTKTDFDWYNDGDMGDKQETEGDVPSQLNERRQYL